MTAPKAQPARRLCSALGAAVNRVMAAASLARAVADHVPDGGDGGKLDCIDAIELHLLRPAAAELEAAYEKMRERDARSGRFVPSMAARSDGGAQ
jgi:hypothetical protein